MNGSNLLDVICLRYQSRAHVHLRYMWIEIALPMFAEHRSFAFAPAVTMETAKMPAKRVSVWFFKGGVGKTMTVRHVPCGLSQTCSGLARA